MKIFQRAILLCLFVAVGVGIALGLGFSTDASDNTPNKHLAAGHDTNTTVLKSNVAKKSAAKSEPGPSTSPVIVTPNPPFANPTTQDAKRQTPSTGEKSPQPTGSFNLGNFSTPSGASLLIQQAAKLLG
ncbi:MAG: hypothetical protein JXM70_28685, partial [Pirellulales bacterium]|nr:hypothetical protein [Pirellulales bacterium]